MQCVRNFKTCWESDQKCHSKERITLSLLWTHYTLNVHRTDSAVLKISEFYHTFFFLSHFLLCCYRQYDLRENSKHSEVLIDLTEFCGQLVEAKCLAVNPRDNNYLAVGANGPFVRLYDIRMIHNYRLNGFSASLIGSHLNVKHLFWYLL